MKRMLFAGAVAVAIVFNLAAAFEFGESAVVVTTFDGLRTAFVFYLASFQAGLNMIPRYGWNQAAETWAGDKVAR